MSSSDISRLIGGLVAVAIVAYISAKARGSAEQGTLRYGSWVVVLGWCCFALVGLATWALFFDQDVWQERSELLSVIGLIVGFGAAAGYCFAEYFSTRGTYDDNGIDFRTPWTGRKTESWSDLTDVEFNDQANWYVLSFRDGNKIRLSKLLNGHAGVLSVLEQRSLRSGR
jgi:Bacterial PH domain